MLSDSGRITDVRLDIDGVGANGVQFGFRLISAAMPATLRDRAKER